MTAAYGRPRKGNLGLRLYDLERFYETALEAERGPTQQERSDQAIAQVQAIIASQGVVPRSESLMSALARSVGMSSQELREYLTQRAQQATVAQTGRR